MDDEVAWFVVGIVATGLGLIGLNLAIGLVEADYALLEANLHLINLLPYIAMVITIATLICVVLTPKWLLKPSLTADYVLSFASLFFWLATLMLFAPMIIEDLGELSYSQLTSHCTLYFPTPSEVFRENLALTLFATAMLTTVITVVRLIYQIKQVQVEDGEVNKSTAC